MPKLALNQYIAPQTLLFAPTGAWQIDPETVNENTVTFWRDTPRQVLDCVATVSGNTIRTETQEQGNGEYFMLLEGVADSEGNPFASLTTRFGIQDGHYVMAEAAKE